MNAVELKNIRARFSLRKTYLFNDINLEIPSEKITSIYGPNAVGKTTLLRIIANITRNIKLDKSSFISYNHNGTKPYIAFAPQDYLASLLPWYGIDYNLSLPLKVKGNHSDDEAKDIVIKLKNYFNYKPDTDKVYELSGGQKQMLVLLRCLVVKPDLLILDEPFSALDIYKGYKLRDAFLKYLEDNKITTLIVSHNLEETVYFSDNIVFLKHDNGTTFIESVENIDIPHPRTSINMYNALILEYVKQFKEKYIHD